jgi:hypothetical protein
MSLFLHGFYVLFVKSCVVLKEGVGCNFFWMCAEHDASKAQMQTANKKDLFFPICVLCM